MDLKCMTSDLKREVQGERNRRRFDEAKRRHSVLGHHEEVDSVLAVLGDESAERYWERLPFPHFRSYVSLQLAFLLMVV